MKLKEIKLPENVSPAVRLIILILGVLILVGINFLFSKSFVPKDAETAVVFQGGLLLVILGSLFLEDKFTKPVDALINALASFIALLTVRHLNPAYWNVVAGYCISVFFLASSSIFLGTPGAERVKNPLLNRFLYRFSITLGKANVIYSLVFLYSLLTFFGIQSRLTVTLVIFWGVYIALLPLKIPHLIQYIWGKQRDEREEIGVICRSENPDLIRVRLKEKAKWKDEDSLVACLPDGSFRQVYPLYAQFQEEIVVGTGLLLNQVELNKENAKPGDIYKIKQKTDGIKDIGESLKEYYHLNSSIKPTGVIVEGSSIGKIRFEVLNTSKCTEGMLVFCKIGDKYVYYQIIEGTTHEETLEQNRHGFQIAQAIQLGTLDKNGTFLKFHWLPEMNIPVFQAVDIKKPVTDLPDDIIEIGRIPKSSIKVFANLRKLRLFHTAILGVTGTGKTEFAFDIIKENVVRKVKTFCVDLTAQYQDTLKELNPKELSLKEEIAKELADKMFEVETGEYGGYKEKPILKSFANKIRDGIKNSVEAFIENDSEYLGIFTLPNISNTKATIYATEIYLSTILNYARNHKDAPDMLVVLEEAHTVIPESATMGVGDRDSRGMIAKISQIALQGRKYRVGLLLIAQRTANVTKTVLSQCNTVFAFSTFDETGINYLANIFGRDFALALPNLDFLQAVTFGKGILSERPVIFQIPYDEKKDTENKIAVAEKSVQTKENVKVEVIQVKKLDKLENL